MKNLEDATITIGNRMTLIIKEVRGSSTMHSPKPGYQEVSIDTKTYFHWRLHGIASKFNMDAVQSDGFDSAKQEVYFIDIESEAGIMELARGFKSRDEAIANAVDFATRNGLEVDGYGASLK